MSIAVLAMYPFAHLRDAYDRLWSAVSTRVDGAPESLDRSIDVHDSWLRDDLLLGQTCGWPLMTRLASRVHVVGAFDHAVGFASGGRYRSVLIAEAPRSVGEWRSMPGCVVAANSDESLSGWVSLCWAWGGPPPNVLATGSHLESVRAVAERRASLASIDAVTFEFIAQQDPVLASLVHVVGHGPSVPSLPLVTSFADRVGPLRDAFRAVIDDPGLAGARSILRIRGFVPFDLTDYASLSDLAHRLRG